MNRATQIIPRTRLITEMVSAQAVRNPSAPAVIANTAVLTYAELEARANELANQLVNLGVRQEQIVALCLDRSFESIISALAVLKTGGAYLPIDPKLPVERFNFVIADAQPDVLITRSYEPGESGSCSVKVIDLGAGRNSDVSSCSIDTPRDELAYVIYTSGSTGNPKGVEITVGNLLNLISWHQSEFTIAPTDRASHLASVAFDAAVWEVWPYLTAGASLYLPDESTRLSPEALRDWIVKNEITISFLPTALAERVIELDWPREVALRCLLTGADTLHRRPPRELPFELVNNYGPTECTVVATSGRVRSEETKELPTIGRPIANTRIHILDEYRQEVTDGEAGEICIGGASVGRGYLNQPELTAEKFIADPFSSENGARLYCTGDVARRLPNGDLAYLGRADEQIKILGYRIEPAEIESAIDRHAGIAESVVIARSYDCSGNRLIAYVTTRAESEPTATELREFLQFSLPHYMVPAVFVKLEELPLTTNGKFDRVSLPDPDDENRLPEQTFAAPRTPTERRVAELLGSLFKVKDLGINDNFFLLGGHSLAGAQLVIKIRNAFGVDLPLRAIFDAPTIAGLSATIEQQVIARLESMSEAEAQALVA